MRLEGECCVAGSRRRKCEPLLDEGRRYFTYKGDLA
jgi:hypothetical protein